ncbi:alcohol dehydrogenase [Pandoraea terrae]|uniref:Alcohol dehydrogenase n=1 Tax=Pandoraea terrae TaxID=1537710 RepID=A0A5E4VE84_9BURK|nr:alcohol dehydrogenase [Pandoraea terrae]VVE09894.1 alcohol dehydrogenase [Pandoraea terrae]
MKTTYRAMQVGFANPLELVERPTPKPGAGEVLIEVDACGVCGADAADIDNANPDLHPPRVPGHEVVGHIAAVGDGVPSMWKLGQRVGVGRKGGHCGECQQCRRGEFQLCPNQPILGASCDGGYAEMMIARATGLVAIPDELSSTEAAPILCAGIATFNALKKSGAQAGDTVAIYGVGGLGHMALQYARKMGFKVVAIGRGKDIEQDALALGAHVYLDTNTDAVVERLQQMGGAQAIVSTVGSADAISTVMPALAPQGRLVLLGTGKVPLTVSPGMMVGGERSIVGSITGSAYENERTLNFSVLADVRPQIETMPLEKANEAVRKMRSGEVKFRMVLTMGNGG